MARERRWIILSEDGRHVTLGRDTDPTNEEIERAGEQLQSLGLGGWLAVVDGFYYRPVETLKLLKVREIAPSSTTWENAEAAFRRIRECAT